MAPVQLSNYDEWQLLSCWVKIPLLLNIALWLTWLLPTNKPHLLTHSTKRIKKLLSHDVTRHPLMHWQNIKVERDDGVLIQSLNRHGSWCEAQTRADSCCCPSQCPCVCQPACQPVGMSFSLPRSPRLAACQVSMRNDHTWSCDTETFLWTLIEKNTQLVEKETHNCDSLTKNWTQGEKKRRYAEWHRSSLHINPFYSPLVWFCPSKLLHSSLSAVVVHLVCATFTLTIFYYTGQYNNPHLHRHIYRDTLLYFCMVKQRIVVWMLKSHIYPFVFSSSWGMY